MRCACVFDVVRQRLRRPLLPPQLPPPNHSSRPIGHSRTVHCGRRMLTPPPLSNWPTSRSLWPHLNETCRVSRLYRRRFLRSNLKSGLKKLDFLKYKNFELSNITSCQTLPKLRLTKFYPTISIHTHFCDFTAKNMYKNFTHKVRNQPTNNV